MVGGGWVLQISVSPPLRLVMPLWHFGLWTDFTFEVLMSTKSIRKENITRCRDVIMKWALWFWKHRPIVPVNVLTPDKDSFEIFLCDGQSSKIHVWWDDAVFRWEIPCWMWYPYNILVGRQIHRQSFFADRWLRSFPMSLGSNWSVVGRSYFKVVYSKVNFKKAWLLAPAILGDYQETAQNLTRVVCNQ